MLSDPGQRSVYDACAHDMRLRNLEHLQHSGPVVRPGPRREHICLHPLSLCPSPSHYTCLHPAPLYPLPFIQHIPQIPACISLPPAPAACPTPLPSSSHHAPLRAAFALQVPPGFESTLIDELSSLGVECDPATQLVVVCEVGTPMPITWVGG